MNRSKLDKGKKQNRHIIHYYQTQGIGGNYAR